MKAITPDETREKILDLLDEKNMTTKDLIDLTGENLNLYKYLSGKTASIHADRIAKIAVALGVSCDYLLTDDDTPPIPTTREVLEQKAQDITDTFYQFGGQFLDSVRQIFS